MYTLVGDLPMPWVVSDAEGIETKYSHDDFIELTKKANADGTFVSDIFRGGSERLWGEFAAMNPDPIKTPSGQIWSEITSDQALLYVIIVGGARRLKRGNSKSSPRPSSTQEEGGEVRHVE
jgi:hypothetical protein